MSGTGVPPQHIPFNFEMPLVDEGGKHLHPAWQQSLNALKQRVEAPASSVPPATASSPGIPGQIAFDATHIYICIAGGTWVRGTLAAF